MKLFVGINKTALLFTFLIALLIWFIPAPAGIDPRGWHMLAIFVATIFGIMTKALSMASLALVALAALTVTQTLSLEEALGGFGNPVVWLVVFAFLVAKSLIKTGLGFRVAYYLISIFGKKTIGLAYGMTLADLLLAPAIPSNSARGGGVIYPIIKSLALTFDSSPEQKTERRIGAYLIQTLYHVNIVTSSMFLTAMAANPMMAEIARGLGVPVSWGSWALAAVVPGVLSLMILPWLLFYLYPPEIKETPEIKVLARSHLKKIGKMSAAEWITFAVFVFMLIFWIFGGLYIIEFDTYYNIADVRLVRVEGVVTALIGVSALMLTGVLNWKDVAEEEAAWSTLFWFSVLLMMAGFLTKFGVITWASEQIWLAISGLHWVIAYSILLLTYFYSHYFFVSSTAHASSMFAPFLLVGLSLGISPAVVTYSLAFVGNLSACLTHYGTSSGPIYYGAGYVDLRTWWKLGAIVSAFHLFVWIGVGSIWWWVIGL